MILLQELYEGGYLRNPLRVGFFDSTACRFLSTEPFLMFLDVLENRGHARSLFFNEKCFY